jgi:integrase
LRGVLKTAPRNHHAYLGHNELPGFLEKLEAYDGSLQTQLAIKLLILTFVRATELRGAKWSEISLERKEWRIPAERMKMRTPHIVPLSSQAIQLLKTLQKLNGHREHVFPSKPSPRKCMSSNAMLFVLWELGYKGKATIHGFRATASTILNESGLFGRDVIERQLAHLERNRIRAAYDHSEHLPARREMMQWWGNYLDGIKSNNVQLSPKKKLLRSGL